MNWFMKEETGPELKFHTTIPCSTYDLLPLYCEWIALLNVWYKKFCKCCQRLYVQIGLLEIHLYFILLQRHSLWCWCIVSHTYIYINFFYRIRPTHIIWPNHLSVLLHDTQCMKWPPIGNFQNQMSIIFVYQCIMFLMMQSVQTTRIIYRKNIH